MKLKLSMLALGGLMSMVALTTTGCGADILGTDSLGDADTAKAEDLSAPTAVKLTVMSETSAKISFSATNATDGADGYVLLDGAAIVEQYALPDFSGDTSFTIAIVKNTAATWTVATVKGSKQAPASPISFNPVIMNGPYSVTKIIAKVAGEGINIDSASITTVAEGAATKAYIDGGDADVFFENSSATEGVTITPLNGGRLVYLADGKMISESDLSEIKTLALGTDLATTTLTSGVVVYSNGKSPKVGDATMGISAGQEFLLVSATGSVARVVIDSVVGDVVSTTVYTAADNEGVTLYKTIK